MAQKVLKRFSARQMLDKENTVTQGLYMQATNISDQNLVLSGAGCSWEQQELNQEPGQASWGFHPVESPICKGILKKKMLSTTLCCLKLWNTYSSSNQQIHLGSLREGLRQGERRLRCGLLIVAPDFSRSTPVRAGVCRATVWHTQKPWQMSSIRQPISIP